MQGCINNYPHPVCGIDSYQFNEKNTSLHDRLVFNTLYPPVNKHFLSVAKFSVYISPYISFSKLVPMTHVLPFLRVLLRRLRMPHEYVRRKNLIFNCFDLCSIDVLIYGSRFYFILSCNRFLISCRMLQYRV